MRLSPLQRHLSLGAFTSLVCWVRFRVCFSDTVVIHPCTRMFPAYLGKFVGGTSLLLGVSYRGWTWTHSNVYMYKHVVESLTSAFSLKAETNGVTQGKAQPEAIIPYKAE